MIGYGGLFGPRLNENYSLTIHDAEIGQDATIGDDLDVHDMVTANGLSLNPQLTNPDNAQTIWTDNTNALYMGTGRLSSAGDDGAVQFKTGDGLDSSDKLNWDGDTLTVSKVAYTSSDITALNSDFPTVANIAPRSASGGHASGNGFNLWNFGGLSDSWYLANGFTADMIATANANVATAHNAGVWTAGTVNVGGGFNIFTDTITPTVQNLVSVNAYTDDAGVVRTITDGMGTAIRREADGGITIRTTDPNAVKDTEIFQRAKLTHDGTLEMHDKLAMVTTTDQTTGMIARNVKYDDYHYLVQNGTNYAQLLELRYDGSLRYQGTITSEDGKKLDTHLKIYNNGRVRMPNLPETANSNSGTKKFVCAGYSGNSLYVMDGFSQTSSASGKNPVYIDSTTGQPYEYVSGKQFKRVTDPAPVVNSDWLDNIRLKRFDDIASAEVENTLGLLANDIFTYSPECVSYKTFTSDVDPDGPDYADIDGDGQPVLHGDVMDKTQTDDGTYVWREIQGIDHVRLNYYLLDYAVKSRARISTLEQEMVTLQNNFAVLQQDFTDLANGT